jgi:hypothetical protein
MIAAILLATAALGAEPAGEVPVSEREGYEPPEVVYRETPRYPGGALRLDAEQLLCTVVVQVSDKGRPTGVEPRDCFAHFVKPTRDALMRWRFRPATVDGEPVASEFLVRIDYRTRQAMGQTLSREEFDRIRASHGLLEDDSEDCVMALTVHSDGAVSSLASNRAPECMALPRGTVAPPRRLFAEGQGLRRCRVRFVSDRGAAEDLDLGDCAKELRGPTSRLVRGWLWNSWEDEGQPYRLTVRWSPDPP